MNDKRAGSWRRASDARMVEALDGTLSFLSEVRSIEDGGENPNSR